MIQDRASWWETLERHWPDIRQCMARFLPFLAHQVISRGDVVPSEQTLGEEIDRLKATRNVFLCRYLFAAWDSAPDEAWIHQKPGWDVLCDLLAEEAVLYEDPVEEIT